MRSTRTVLLVIALAVVAAVAWILTRSRSGSAAPNPTPAAAEVAATTAGEAVQPAIATDEGAVRREAVSDNKPTVGNASQGPSQSVPVPEPALHGRVIDDLGDPVGSFELEVTDVEAEARASRAGDYVGEATRHRFKRADGSFDVQHLIDGEYTLVAWGTGDTRSAPVTVRHPPTTTEPTLILPRAAAITGTIATGGNTPLRSAAVLVEYVGGEKRTFVAPTKPRAQSDVAGRFRIDGVQPGSVRVMATHADCSEGEWTEVAVAPGCTADVTLTLSQGGRITGVIDLSQGEIADRQINLYSFRGDVGWRQTTSDRQGTFVIEHVIPQSYVIELAPTGHPVRVADGGQPRIRRQITVLEGETTDVVFGSQVSRLRVSGRVLCNSSPLALVEVTARSSSSEDRGLRATTAADGQFSLEVDGPGNYLFTVSAGWDSYYFKHAVAAEGESNLTFDVPGGEVSGTVVSPEGAPPLCQRD